MEKISLEVKPRPELGTGNAGRLRRAGSIPGIVYGKGFDPTAVSVEERALRAAFRRGLRLGRLVELSWTDGQSPAVALLRDLQLDPVYDRPVHLDFQVVLSTQPLVVEVPLEVRGTPVGVREEGGHLEQHVWDVKIRVLPDRIPEKLVLEVADLKAGASLHVSDIVWDEGTILADPSLAVLTVARPRVEAPSVEAAEEEPTPEEAPTTDAT